MPRRMCFPSAVRRDPAIDAWFDHCFGALPYRSLRFEHEHLPDTAQYQAVGTVNYPNEHAYTRITEFRHLTGQEHTGTSIVREYPQAEGDPPGYRVHESATPIEAARPTEHEESGKGLPAGVNPASDRTSARTARTVIVTSPCHIDAGPL